VSGEPGHATKVEAAEEEMKIAWSRSEREIGKKVQSKRLNERGRGMIKRICGQYNTILPRSIGRINSTVPHFSSFPDNKGEVLPTQRSLSLSPDLSLDC
jgi:hypothetical protein